MTTPAEKDAMALAVLRENADDIGRCATIFRESQMAAAFTLTAEQMEKASVEIAEARAHLAARVAAQAERIAQLEANETVLLRNFNRAEAELAAVRANAERYVWLRESPSAGVEVMTDDGIRSLSESELDTAIDAARGAG